MADDFVQRLEAARIKRESGRQQRERTFQLINVLYEQALRQAERRVEIEQAFERRDEETFNRLWAQYKEDEQLGASIG